MIIKEFEIIYRVDESNEDKVRIFGKKFIENNKDKCKIKYNNEIYELKEYFNDIDNNYNNKDMIKFKVEIFDEISDLSYMFHVCKSLTTLSGISNLVTSNVKDINSMFKQCHSLISLEDISKWDTSNVKDMKYLFGACNSLISLSDISNWNTSNVENMESMFNACPTLISLPDITKWNISNCKRISNIFEECISCLNVPQEFLDKNSSSDDEESYEFDD